jgi:HlyD family secretion protein
MVNQIYPKAFVTLSELGVEENRQTVSIDLPTSDYTLAFGLEVETMVMIEPPREMLLIPIGAVVEKNSKQYVEVLVDGTPIEREILTGINVEGNIEVINGLEEGDQVILNYQNE